MKKFFEGLMAFRLLRHRQHRNMVQRVGRSLLSVHRGRTMMVLGGVALLAEALRRRPHTNELPSLRNSGGRHGPDQGRNGFRFLRVSSSFSFFSSTAR